MFRELSEKPKAIEESIAEGPGEGLDKELAEPLEEGLEQAAESNVSVLKNRDFLLLWGAQAVSQTAQNAIWFALMVVVEDTTQSSMHLSMVVITTIIPGIVFGMIAGAFVDRMNKKTVLVTTNLLRAIAILGYLLYAQALIFIYVVNLVFCSISQFFGPAEASTIPHIVPRRQLVTANSLFNLTFTGSQMAGIVILAPWVIKLFGASALFILAAGMLLVATFLVSLLPPGATPHKSLSSLRRETIVNEMWAETKEGWSFISSDRVISLAVRHLTLIAGLLLVMSMIAPTFVVRVLHINAEDSVYVLAPAGIGVLLGATTMSRLVARFGKAPLVNLGLVTMGISLLAMSLLKWAQVNVGPLIAPLAGGAWPNSFGIAAATMVIAAFLGFAAALVMVPSQTILMERTPVPIRGRIFAVQMMLGNVASILPLVFLGGIADLFGIDKVIALSALGILWLGWIAIRQNRAVLAAASSAIPSQYTSGGAPHAGSPMP